MYAWNRKFSWIIYAKLRFRNSGGENIPADDAVIFCCNHSNSHDFFTLAEVFAKLKKQVTPLASLDGLNAVAKLVFHMDNSTFIQRESKTSKKAGEYSLCNSLINGISAMVFAESTWNLHPTNAMLPIKAGPVEMALITGKKIVPTIFEYVEVPYKCHKERELYSRCVVCFGEPIAINMDEGIFEQTEAIQKKMENMRQDLWK